MLAQENADGEGAAGTGEQAANGFEGMNGVEHGQEGEAAGVEARTHQDDAAVAGAAGAGTGIRGERQPNKERITTPYLTKYERARVLGTRALQIRCGLCLFLCCISC